MNPKSEKGYSMSHAPIPERKKSKRCTNEKRRIQSCTNEVQTFEPNFESKTEKGDSMFPAPPPREEEK